MYFVFTYFLGFLSSFLQSFFTRSFLFFFFFGSHFVSSILPSFPFTSFVYSFCLLVSSSKSFCPGFFPPFILPSLLRCFFRSHHSSPHLPLFWFLPNVRLASFSPPLFPVVVPISFFFFVSSLIPLTPFFFSNHPLSLLLLIFVSSYSSPPFFSFRLLNPPIVFLSVFVCMFHLISPIVSISLLFYWFLNRILPPFSFRYFFVSPPHYSPFVYFFLSSHTSRRSTLGSFSFVPPSHFLHHLSLDSFTILNVPSISNYFLLSIFPSHLQSFKPFLKTQFSF